MSPVNSAAALIVVSPNSRLGRMVAAVDRSRRCEPIQLRSFTNLRQKLTRHPLSFLLVETSLAEWGTVQRELNLFRRDFPVLKFGVFCPELPLLPVSAAELIQFSFLETGATVVLTNFRDLPGVLLIVRRHLDEAPAPPQDRILEIRRSLPWM